MTQDNLTTKCLWELDSNDTIYMNVKLKGNTDRVMFLCKFVKLVHNTVYGIPIEATVNPEIYKNFIGKNESINVHFKNCCVYGKGRNESHDTFHWFNPMGYAYKELDLEETEKRITHPSFGMIGLSRRHSSSAVSLFGSNIQHQNTMTITIKAAEMDRKLSNDWFFGREQLIEVELSGSQLADLLTSMNMGDGVPCTIRQLKGQSYPDPPYENPTDIAQNEFKAMMSNLSVECKSSIEDAVNMLKNKSSIGKSDREFLIDSIQKFITEISSNIPFVSQQFVEATEKTITEAKKEVEMFVTAKIHALGIDVAKTNPNVFLEGFSGNAQKEITDQE